MSKAECWMQIYSKLSSMKKQFFVSFHKKTFNSFQTSINCKNCKNCKNCTNDKNSARVEKTAKITPRTKIVEADRSWQNVERPVLSPLKMDAAIVRNSQDIGQPAPRPQAPSSQDVSAWSIANCRNSDIDSFQDTKMLQVLATFSWKLSAAVVGCW